MLSRSRPLLLPLFLLQPADAAQDAQPHDTVVGPLLRGLVGGAGYGFAAAAISHPFDTIKVRLQSGGAAKAGSASVGGLLSLYRGVGPATAASIVFRAARCSLLAPSGRLLHPLTPLPPAVAGALCRLRGDALLAARARAAGGAAARRRPPRRGGGRRDARLPRDSRGAGQDAASAAERVVAAAAAARPLEHGLPQRRDDRPLLGRL